MSTTMTPAAADAATRLANNAARVAAAALRHRRATLAQRLIDLAPSAVEAVDWDALDQAPDWLALPDASFLILQARLGALLHRPAMRLWIDGPRLVAVCALLGDSVFDDLLAQRDTVMPIGLAPLETIESAAQVGPRLRAAGVAVLLAALPPGTLRDAVCKALAPIEPSRMSAELAETLIARARALGQGGR